MMLPSAPDQRLELAERGVCKEGSEPERNGGTRGESGQMPGGQWDQRRISRVEQFGAVLRKNFILLTRRRRVLCGLGGWAALILEVLVPALFFALMCIPKYYVPKPVPIPEQLYPSTDLDSGFWGQPYFGPAATGQTNAHVLYAPNTSAAVSVMDNFARAVACPPPDSSGNSFFRYFSIPDVPPLCAQVDRKLCQADPSCWQPVRNATLQGFANATAALDFVRATPDRVDAVILLDDFNVSSVRYTLRVNHSAVTSTRQLSNPWGLLPDGSYKNQWFFTNLQVLIDRSVLGWLSGDGTLPMDISVRVKPFPWPASQIDPGAMVAAAAFNLLLVYAFLAPTRAAVVTIVREKELRLREGMRILGLKDAAYWASWVITHWTVMAVSGTICASIAIYPFQHSDFTVMLLLFWLVALALISFSYCLSTLFSKSRVAGTASAMLYAASMFPGYLMPTFEPYGGTGWWAACILPPSAVSLFASILMQLESNGRGVRWSSINAVITYQGDFSAASVFIMLTVDVFFYGILTWYLDKVIPSEFGSNLPPWFLLMPSYWSRVVPRRSKERGLAAAAVGLGCHLGSSELDPDVVVSIQDLRKVFRTTDGTKAAVDGLSLDIHRDQITALLGHNGAGKTTAISILTGMIRPTSGTAYVEGRSILTQMGPIRESLGVCPQFDILWPEITVREHLQIYARIKGFSRAAARAIAIESARDVGLEEKLDCMAGDLSGGQRRKLSVSISFLGSPAIVFLDEPTSGMDPYSRRFTWEVIKRNRTGRAIVLTSHSMEEADLLGDVIAIMAEGKLAAYGTALDLKSQYGVGYTLTVVRSRTREAEGSKSAGAAAGLIMSAADSELERLVKQHVPDAELVSRSAGETSFRLRKEESTRFPALLRELEAKRQALGVDSYGLSVTTLEEVFLRVTEGAGEKLPKDSGQDLSVVELVSVDHPPGSGQRDRGAASDEAMGGDNGRRLKGATLYLQQLYGLFLKRALSARRDKMALVTQLLVPVALVLIAMWSGRSSAIVRQEPPLALSREMCMLGKPTPWGASPEMRDNATQLAAFLEAYGADSLVPSNAQRVWQNASSLRPALDDYLLDHWFTNDPVYDAVFLQEGMTGRGKAAYTVLGNQTAMHALPASINAVNTALLRLVTGNPNASIVATNLPLPTLKDEVKVKIGQAAVGLLLVLCLTMAASVLSSSYAVFVVRERESNSLHVQLVSGAPLSAVWFANYAWDLITFLIPVSVFVIIFVAFKLPAFRGLRLAAAVVLLVLFGLSSLPLTYFLSSFFDDEMKAMQRINTVTFLVGFLGFLSMWIFEIVTLAMPFEKPKRIFKIASTTLSALSPHYNLARGTNKLMGFYDMDLSNSRTPPFSWACTGKYLAFMGGQAVVFMALTLLMESGILGSLYRALEKQALLLIARWSGDENWARLYRSHSEELFIDEDPDVRDERQLLSNGASPHSYQVLLDGVSKTYSQGLWQPPVYAVLPLWLGVPPGECFGLLGLNGAGKTTTFRMLTGEVFPDTGNAYVAAWSIRKQLGKARRCMGYCPQFNALPGGLTAREVLWLYARLRGVPPTYIPGLVGALLDRIDLRQYADRACETFSGGNKRKLSVAVALVGSPPVVLLDEPSTGMDPGARRFLWTIIQRQVIDRGHTVVLTSHSMEECEALCSRLAIMAAGQMRCLGTPQHLKNRFGAGYGLELRLRSEANCGEAIAVVQALCPAATLTQRAGTRLSFRIPQQVLDLAAAFEGIERERERLGLDEYSISQTTLEQVFVAVARQGNPDTQPDS